MLSLLIGSVAALMAYLYVDSAQDRAFKGTELVSALVVTGDVPKGVTGDEVLSKSLVKQESVPMRYRPETALTSEDAIRGKVAIANVAKGQVLVQGMFVDPIVAQETAAKRVPAGQVGVTVSVSDVTGVAGLITPGDMVNIYARGPDASEHLLFSNVNVLYIGKTPAPTAGATGAIAVEESNLVTFAVPPLAAAKIIYASQQENGIHLGLVNPENKPVPVPPVNAGNVYTQGGRTPYEG